MTQNLKLTDEWDKIFKLSDKVNHKKITFHNRFGITLAADLYEPKGKTSPPALFASSSVLPLSL